MKRFICWYAYQGMEPEGNLMKKYEITIQRVRRGEVINTKKVVINSQCRPKVGEGEKLLVHPPIFEKIIKVKEILQA